MTGGADLVLRCRTCRDAVNVGPGDCDSWRLPLWDHLLDFHMDMVVLGRQSELEFNGIGGIRAYITEQQTWEG